MTNAKDEAAQKLINWHFSIGRDIVRIYRFLAENEDQAGEPIKLLEVSNATLKTGRVDAFAFGPAEDISYPSIVAQVTPEEMTEIEQGNIPLPTGWRMDSTKLYAAPEPALASR